MSWESDLEKACLNTPSEISPSNILKLVAAFLKERKPAIILCRWCGKNAPVTSSKGVQHQSCDNCRKERKEKQDAEKAACYRRHYEEQRKRNQKAADNFGKGINTPAKDFWLLEGYYNEEKDYKDLHEMPYADFLTTVYWKIIARYVKYKKDHCSLCDSKSNLNVHHRTYKNRGREIKHLGDLIVLCNNCHKKHHVKED